MSFLYNLTIFTCEIDTYPDVLAGLVNTYTDDTSGLDEENEN